MYCVFYSSCQYISYELSNLLYINYHKSLYTYKILYILLYWLFELKVKDNFKKHMLKKYNLLYFNMF